MKTRFAFLFVLIILAFSGSNVVLAQESVVPEMTITNVVREFNGELPNWVRLSANTKFGSVKFDANAKVDAGVVDPQRAEVAATIYGALRQACKVGPGYVTGHMWYYNGTFEFEWEPQSFLLERDCVELVSELGGEVKYGFAPSDIDLMASQAITQPIDNGSAWANRYLVIDPIWKQTMGIMTVPAGAEADSLSECFEASIRFVNQSVSIDDLVYFPVLGHGIWAELSARNIDRYPMVESDIPSFCWGATLEQIELENMPKWAGKYIFTGDSHQFNAYHDPDGNGQAQKLFSLRIHTDSEKCSVYEKWPVGQSLVDIMTYGYWDSVKVSDTDDGFGEWEQVWVNNTHTYQVMTLKENQIFSYQHGGYDEVIYLGIFDGELKIFQAVGDVINPNLRIGTGAVYQWADGIFGLYSVYAESAPFRISNGGYYVDTTSGKIFNEDVITK